MARIHGNRGQIKMDPLGGSSVVTVADMNGWTLDTKKERAVVTSFGDTNVTRVTGLPDYTGTFSGLWNAASSPVLFDVIFGTVNPFLHLIPDTSAPTYLFKGLANIDGGIKVSATGAVTIDGSWDAAGNWVMEP